jgi:hypothetical protein
MAQKWRMQQRIYPREWRLTYAVLIVFLGLLFAQHHVASAYALRCANRGAPARSTPVQDSAAADEAYDQAKQLISLRTKEAYRKALTKFKEALSLYRAAGNRRGEGATLIQLRGRDG